MTDEEYLSETVAMMQEKIVSKHFIINKTIERSQYLSEACSESREPGPQKDTARRKEEMKCDLAELRIDKNSETTTEITARLSGTQGDVQATRRNERKEMTCQ